MTKSGRRSTGPARCARGDEGAAVLEFALIAVLLFTIVFGIISFGLILSFKQDMTRAAAEGARAGAVALPGDAAHEADLAVADAVKAFGGSFSGPGCARDGMSCQPATVAACESELGVECVTVTLEYDYDTHPLYGRVPLIEMFLPDVVRAESVARVNG